MATLGILPVVNHTLAKAIREVERRHEASYDPSLGATICEGLIEGGYNKTYWECIGEVVGNDPIQWILACLFTAGYCDMFDFCDEVLGKQPAKPDRSPKTGEE